MEAVRNIYTGEVLAVRVTPLNGAHIVVKVGGRGHEYHRGNAATAGEYLVRLVSQDSPRLWEPWSL